MKVRTCSSPDNFEQHSDASVFLVIKHAYRSSRDLRIGTPDSERDQRRDQSSTGDFVQNCESATRIIACIDFRLTHCSTNLH